MPRSQIKKVDQANQAGIGGGILDRVKLILKVQNEKQHPALIAKSMQKLTFPVMTKKLAAI